MFTQEALDEIHKLDQLKMSREDQIISKVDSFMERHPVNPTFIRREKGRLPYSVFKPHSQEVPFLKSIF
jgi:hypothetical protein